MTRLIPVLFFFIVIAACSKDGGPSTPLTGKWKAIEMFDGRVSTGCLCWAPINDWGSSYMKFKSDGSYENTPPLYSAMIVCQGTYRIINDSTLSLTNSCGGTPVETMHWFKKEGDTLTIAYDLPNYPYKIKFRKERRL